MSTQYANGEVPLSSLTRTSAGPYLRTPAAVSYERMAGDFKAELGYALLLSDGYRAKAGPFGQIAIFEDRYPSRVSLGVADCRGPWRRSSHPSLGAQWWWRRRGAAAAAVPGTSVHGTGDAADFASGVNTLGTKGHRWMNANGPRYGWVWPTWAQRSPTLEPWHREYHEELDTYRGARPVLPTTATTQEDSPMLILSDTTTGYVAVIYPSGRWALVVAPESAASLRAVLPSAAVDTTTWHRMLPADQRTHTLPS